jgi:hypothetical protein
MIKTETSGLNPEVFLFVYLYIMVQGIIIAVLILAASVYLIRIMLRSFKGNTPCESGCGKCAVGEKIEVPASK